MHAFGGATDARGTAIRPIYGPALDGTLPGNEIIIQSAAANGGVVYARAIGPMQFLPDTWARYAADGQTNPQNIFDSALAAARYLCSGGLNLRDQSQVVTAVMRYNNSMPYTQNVLGWAAAYVTGVVPMNLPPLEGPIPPIGDMHVSGSANVARTGHGTPSTPADLSTRNPATPADGHAGSPAPRSSSRGSDATNTGDAGSSNAGKAAHGGAENVWNGARPTVTVGDGRNGLAR